MRAREIVQWDLQTYVTYPSIISIKSGFFISRCVNKEGPSFWVKLQCSAVCGTRSKK